MDYLDKLRAEVTAILNKDLLDESDVRMLGRLEQDINNYLNRYDY
jgi:hypothetical protein